MALTKISTPAIKDEAITLAKLLHGDSNSNGKFLRANNGADPTFETIDLTALSASNLTSGTLPDARFPATLPAASAANLTNIPAANITGTLPAIDGSNLTGLSGVSVANQADNRLITCTGTTDALNAESYWIISGASLALGTSSPLANIHLRNSYVHLRIDSDGSNNDTNFSMITGTGKNNNINFGDAADDNVGIISYDHNGDQMKFIVGASERMRLDADGLSFNGDSAAANSLNDYEEGEATITVYSNNNVSLNATYNKMDYTKIGNVVTITGLIIISGVSSTNYFSINLPFTNVNHGNPRRTDAIGAVMHNNVNTGDCGLVSYIPMGSSILYFYKVSDNSSWSILTNSDLASNDEMYFTVTYKTA